MPGLAFFLLCVVVAVILFVYIKPFKKAADLHGVEHAKLKNFIDLVKGNLDNPAVTDGAYREHIRQTLAIYEGRDYTIPGSEKDDTPEKEKIACHTSDQ